jgi:ABC-2 type transport system permease protein
MTGAQYFAGLSMAHVAIALVQSALVYGITYLVGGSFMGPLAAGFLVLALTTGAYVGSGFIIGTHYASGADEINGTVAGIGVPLLVLGGTFFSVDLLPPSIYALAHLNPIFHMNQAFRSLAMDAAPLGEAWPNLAFLGVFTVGAVWMGARAYDRMLRVEREA